MLPVGNALTGDERPDLSTTKKAKAAHGFGLAGMREIAARYGISESAVQMRLNRTRAKLCTYLEKEGIQV